MKRIPLISILIFCAAVLLLVVISGRSSDAARPQAASPDFSSPSPPSSSVEPSPTPEPTPMPTPEPAPEPYYFGLPVEESEPVEEEWFADAVFLGDSRTEGLQIYSGLHTGDFFWHKGMTVFRVDDPEYRRVEVDGQAMTVLEALALKPYAKVYIMIGVNELGYPASSYDSGLRTMVDRVKEIQPDAVIYLQTLPPVNEKVAAESGLGKYINNSNVNAFNDIVVQVARDKEVALLDVASALRTEQGDLAEDMAADGVHFRRQGYEIWYGYLKRHTLDPASYAAGQAAPELPEEEGPEPPEAPDASDVPALPDAPETAPPAAQPPAPDNAQPPGDGAPPAPPAGVPEGAPPNQSQPDPNAPTPGGPDAPPNTPGTSDTAPGPGAPPAEPPSGAGGPPPQPPAETAAP